MMVVGRAVLPLLRRPQPQLLRPARLLTSARSASSLSVSVNEQGIALVRLDCPGEKQNSLSDEMMGEFETVAAQVANDPKIKAAVLISGKPGSFIAGANIKMIEKLGASSYEAVHEVGLKGQQCMDELEAMQKKKPWVAAIDGPCLGGGLEMALCCAHRVASTSSKTVLGLPEVMLGLLPGAGGTQRLPKLIGAAKALDLMLTGKQLKAERAKKMSLVDFTCDANALERTAVAVAMQAADGSIKPKKRKLGWTDWFLEKTAPGRSIMFGQAEKQVAKQSKGKYPAPYGILASVRAGLEGGHVAGSKVERERFAKLATTPESAALRGLFFGSTECKKNPFGAVATPVMTMGVLGAGLMGAGIAEVSATKSMRVLLKDRDLKGLSRGEAQITGNLGKKLTKNRLTKYAHDTAVSRIIGLTDAHASWKRHFAQADMVIEAVFEEMGVKHKVVAEMEAIVGDKCIIASNTSTLPIGEIASVAKRPQNIVGMHYFSPVDKMPLLEVIPHAGTSKEVCAAAVDVGIRQGKTVIAVKDVPGFYVNRCLGPFLAEAVALIQQGADPLNLNSALTDFGMPVGGVTLADEVGIDVSRHVVNNLVGEQPKFLGVRMEGADLTMLDAFVKAGFLGRKAGKGFFDYSDKQAKVKPINKEALAIIDKFRHPSKKADTLSKPELAERMVLRFLIEAVHCLETGVIRNARDGDIGAVFGIGFPPFLGGPFMYMDKLGAKTVVEKLSVLQKEHGDQFAPPKLLLEHAQSGRPFHGPASA